MTPGFLIIGGQRCGTTSMYRTLREHPAVLQAVLHKGVHYFDTSYDRGMAWYRGALPAAARRADRVRAADSASGPLTFESSPYYMFHPLAADRIARDLPGRQGDRPAARPGRAGVLRTRARARARLRDRGLRDGARAGGVSRLAGEAERMLADPRYHSHTHQHHGYLQRGRYVDHLERLAAIFGRDRMHVVDSHRFFTDPEPVYDDVAASSSACRTPATRASSGTTPGRAAPCRAELRGAARGALRPLRRAAGRLARAARCSWRRASTARPADVSTADPVRPEAPARRRAPGWPALARGGAAQPRRFRACPPSPASSSSLAVTRALPQDAAGHLLRADVGVPDRRDGGPAGHRHSGLVWAIVARPRPWASPERVRAFLRVALTPVVGARLVLAVGLVVGAGRSPGWSAGGRRRRRVRRPRARLPAAPDDAVGRRCWRPPAGTATILPDRGPGPGRAARCCSSAAVVGWPPSTASVGGAVRRLGGCRGCCRRCSRRGGCCGCTGGRTRPAADPVGPSAAPWREFWAFTAPRAVDQPRASSRCSGWTSCCSPCCAGPAEAAVYTAATRFLVVGQVANQAPDQRRGAPAGRAARGRRPGGRPGGLPDGDRLARAAHLAAVPARGRLRRRRARHVRQRLRRGRPVVLVLAGHDAAWPRRAAWSTWC